MNSGASGLDRRRHISADHEQFWQRTGDLMTDVRLARAFEANLPNLNRLVRISSFYEAQVFVRRWAIRDKDRTIRALVRRMERANSTEAADSAIEELKRALAARGLLPDMELPRS